MQFETVAFESLSRNIPQNGSGGRKWFWEWKREKVK